MKRAIYSFILLLLISMQQYDAKAQTANDSEDHVVQSEDKILTQRVDQIFEDWSSKDGPGAAVAVIQDGQIIYTQGYGMANLEYDIPNTPSSVFHIASVSKQFTVFSILLLEKEGKLSLDDDVRKYLPEVPDFGEVITLRHLASHTSGLRDQWNLLSMAGWRFDDVITKEHVLKLVSKQKELNFSPGDEYTYCNTGFTLLAEVVARVSGQSFAEFTAQNIFEPLHMESTLFYDDHEKIVKNRTYSYYKASEGYKKRVLSYANVGATSLFTTVEDLSLWAMNFNNLTVGDEVIFETMRTRSILNNGDTISHALGQFVGEYRGVKEIQHGGADAGYRTYLARYPEENFAVVVFGNAAEFNPGELAHKVVDVYLEDRLENKPEETIIPADTLTEAVEVDQEILDTYVGGYLLQVGISVEVKKENERLIVATPGEPDRLMTPLSATIFKVEDTAYKLEFVKNPATNEPWMKVYINGQTMVGTRIADLFAGELDLNKYTGDYFSEELETTYHLVIENDELVAKHQRVSDFKLKPTGNDKFNGETWFFSTIEFIKNDQGEVSGFKATNGRVRNLKFDKVK